jgi:hypothetical protein
MSKRQQICAAAGLALGIAAWCFCYSVSIPDWKAHEPASLTSTAARSDLYPRWLGARELLLHHRNPYSQGVTLQIESGYYGRPVAGAYVADPQLFSYPLYVVFLLAPAIRVDFPVVRFAVSLLLFVATAASVRWWFSAFPQLRSSANLLPLALIFTLGSWPVVQGISVQQLTLLVSALLAAATAAVARRQFWLAGALLAVATIKPQLSLPYAAWLMVWGAAGWKTPGAALELLAEHDGPGLDHRGHPSGLDRGLALILVALPAGQDRRRPW